MLFAMGIDKTDKAVEDIVGRAMSGRRGMVDVKERIIIRSDGAE